MNATLRRLLQEGSAVARSDGTVHAIFPTSVSHDVGHALRRWVERERPTKTLEIGLGYGVSALFICDQLPAVAKAASFCITNLGWTLEETSTRDDLHHWAALRLPAKPDNRPYDSYADF